MFFSKQEPQEDWQILGTSCTAFTFMLFCYVSYDFLFVVLLLYWWSYSRPSNMVGLAAGIARFYELCVTALLYPLSLYLADSNTTWHFCWCIIQWGTNYPGSWYKEISFMPYSCSNSSYFVNREFPSAGHSTTHCNVNYIPVWIKTK